MYINAHIYTHKYANIHTHTHTHLKWSDWKSIFILNIKY